MSDLVPGSDGFSLPDAGSSPVSFSAEEMQELQLTVLTAVEPARRQEAFRRLLLSQLAPETKQSIAFRVLQDREPALQQDALAALEGLGAASGPVDLMMASLDEDPARVAQACGQFLQEVLDDSIGPWVIGFLVRRYEQLNDDVALMACARALAAHRDYLSIEIIPHVVSRTLLLENAPAAEGRKILQGWANQPERGAALHAILIRHEVGAVGEWLLPEIARSGWRDTILCQTAVNQLHRQNSLTDPAVIANLIAELGEPTLELLLDGFGESKRPAYALHVVQLVVRQGGIDPELQNRIVDFCLETLGSDRQDVLPVLLEFPLGELGLDPTRHRRWLRELLMARERVSSPHLLNEIDFRLRRAGTEAVDVLIEGVRYAGVAEERVHALKMLTELCPDDEDRLAGVAALIDEMESSDEMDLGALIQCRGRLWGRKKFSSASRNSEVTEALSVLWRRSRTLERLEALPYAIAHVSAPLATQIVMVMIELLETRLPQMEKRSLKKGAELLDSALLEQRYLVAALQAACRSFSRDDLLTDLAERFEGFLVSAWDSVRGGEISWGPDGTRHLVRALVSLAKHNDDRTRDTITRLLQEPGFHEVQLGMIELWDRLIREDRDRIARFLANRLREPRTLEEEELDSLLHLARTFVESCPDDSIDNGKKILHRVKGIRSYATRQIDHFMGTLQLKQSELLSFIGQA